MAIKLDDRMPFGKYKDVLVTDVVTTDPGYLCWLRDDSKAKEKSVGFSREVHEALNAKITAYKSRLRKYSVWKLSDLSVSDAIKVQVSGMAEAAAQQGRHQIVYADWGSW